MSVNTGAENLQLVAMSLLAQSPREPGGHRVAVRGAGRKAVLFALLAVFVRLSWPQPVTGQMLTPESRQLTIEGRAGYVLTEPNSGREYSGSSQPVELIRLVPSRASAEPDSDGAELASEDAIAEDVSSQLLDFSVVGDTVAP